MKYNNPIYRSDQPYRNIAVYQYLRERAGKRGYCWPSVATIAEDIGMSKRTDILSGGTNCEKIISVKKYSKTSIDGLEKEGIYPDRKPVPGKWWKNI